MKTSLAGAMEIIGHEGIVLTRYKDSVGVWTIGVGHTAAAGSPDPRTFKGSLTLKEAIDLFRRDLAKYEARVNRAFKVPLKQHQFDAAVSFDFNTGAIHKATWVKSFNAGSPDRAAKEIMNWTKPPEIAPRRRKEQSLFKTGLYTGAGFATVYPATDTGRVLWGQGKRVDLAKEYGRMTDEPIKPPEKPADAQEQPEVIVVPPAPPSPPAVIVVEDNPKPDMKAPSGPKGLAVLAALVASVLAGFWEQIQAIVGGMQ